MVFAAEAPAAPCVHPQQYIYTEGFKTKSVILLLPPVNNLVALGAHANGKAGWSSKMWHTRK